MKTCSKCGEEKDVGEFKVKHNQCKECLREWRRKYQKTSEKHREAKRKYRTSEKGRAANRKYQKTEKYRGVKRKYQKTEKGRASQRKYRKSEKGKAASRRSNQNPIIRLRTLLRSRLKNFIKGHDTQLNRETMGCTLNEFRAHYESLFKPGMGWRTYGVWVSDHIIPMCRFDLTKDEEVKKCMHYTNLQPLWRWDNIKKGSK